MHRVEWSAAAHEDVSALFDYVAEHDSLWDAAKLCERVLNSTDKLAEFPGCTRPRQSTARACAGSVWPGSMCSTRWTTRNKSFASWPLSASGRTRAGSRASHDAPPAAPLPVLQRGEQSRRSDDRQRGPKLGPSLPWPRRCSIVRSRRSSSAFLASRSLSRAWACPSLASALFPASAARFSALVAAWAAFSACWTAAR